MKGVAWLLQIRSGGLSWTTWRPDGGLSREKKDPPVGESNLSCLGSRTVLSLAEAERKGGGGEGGRAGGLEATGSFEQTLRWLHPMESVTWWGGLMFPLEPRSGQDRS